VAVLCPEVRASAVGISEKIDPGGAVFDAMISHVHGMSRDIALMQRLGPNPAATMRWITDGLKIEAHQSKHAGTNRIKKAKASAIRVKNMFQELTGGFDVENEGLARFMQGVRSWEARQAGRGGHLVDRRRGDPDHGAALQRPSRGRVVGDYIGSLKPSSAADRAHAARQLFIADRAIRTMGAYSRWTGETMTGEIPARLSDAVMSLSYLSKWTDDGHRLFNHQVWAAITDNAATVMGHAQSALPAMFERYGLGESDWNTIRSTPAREDGGAKWILPKNIPTRAEPAHCRDDPDRSEFAVPTGARSASARQSTPAPQRAAFPASSGARFCCSAASRCSCSGCTGAGCLRPEGRGLEYAATLFISSTVMGMLAYQLKQIVAGKDPVNMDPHENPAFLAKAAFQGGGLGIMGDFINSATSRSGQSALREQPAWARSQARSTTFSQLRSSSSDRRRDVHVGPNNPGKAFAS
jgi:hypothetical protein